jgi:acyl phosphate:glycerol-3-phosphate acyltransferase
MTPSLLALLLFSYLLGSIPFSHLIAYWQTGLSLHEVGEGNVGSRNVWHVVGPSWGFLAAILDICKGLIAFFVGRQLHVSTSSMLFVGIAVILGHQFPLFLHGQGGKGVATAIGFLLGLSPLSTLGAGIIFGVCMLILRDFNHSLIPTIIAVILLPIVFHQPLWVAVYALIFALILGGKKLLDHPHEANVWASHPWDDGATPGWHQETGDEEVSSPDMTS